jgi:hypothetical protein
MTISVVQKTGKEAITWVMCAAPSIEASAQHLQQHVMLTACEHCCALAAVAAL